MDNLINIEQAASMLAIQVSTLYAWVHKRKIPHVKLSKSCLRFRGEDLNAFIAASVVDVANEPARKITKEPVVPRNRVIKHRSTNPTVLKMVARTKKEVLG
ncbi:MAG TPA: helix-turn-helix domain-containing protein [Dissulfurispiraceae bacterium]|nr:helix-turn-helix domain-containing protein [Dissulfurispiraceae bacterium]